MGKKKRRLIRRKQRMVTKKGDGDVVRLQLIFSVRYKFPQRSILYNRQLPVAPD